MSYSTISGILKDPDGIAWKQATWTAVPVSPSSKPVFSDGSAVPAVSGNLDQLGTFSGQVPQTSSILPPGSTLTITITSLTSAAPVTLTKVQIIAPTTDLGALLSARIPAPRIQCGPIVYAYDPIELVKPVHGNGYVNTYLDRSFMFMQNTWVMLGATNTFNGNVQAEGFEATGPFTPDIPATTAQVSMGVIGSEQPYLALVSGLAPLDAKNWDFYVDQPSGTLHGRLNNDAGSETKEWLTVTRNGDTPNKVTISAPIQAGAYDDASGAPLLRATLRFASPIQAWPADNYRMGGSPIAIGDSTGSTNANAQSLEIGSDCTALAWQIQYTSANAAAVPSGEPINIRFSHYTPAPFADLWQVNVPWGPETSGFSQGSMNLPLKKGDVVGAIIVMPGGMVKPPTASAISLQILCY
jgi:hypothetical protein